MASSKYDIQKKPNNISVYVDASVSRELDNGSIGVVIFNETLTERILEYGEFFHEKVTINRMESIAAGCGMKELYVIAVKKKMWVNKLTLYSDSEYFVNHATVLLENQDKAEKLIVQHEDVWYGILQMIELWQKKGITPEFKKIKAHSNIVLHDRADSLAKRARNKGVKYLKDFGLNGVINGEVGM